MYESISPMLAQPVSEIPRGDFFYEPKWDGFRAIVSKGKVLSIWSRDGKDLTRYFPELSVAFDDQLEEGVVLDGEIVVQISGHLDFSALQQRIHPAASRVQLLSRQTPASFIAFDLLAHRGDLSDKPFSHRRDKLQKLELSAPIFLTASTRDYDVACEWFSKFRASGVDGIVAKESGLTYLPDVRAMKKIKHFNTADCVVAGFRLRKSDPKQVGALLLGLYDSNHLLQYVGSTSSFTAKLRQEIFEILQPLVVDEHPWLNPQVDQRAPGALSRWSGKKDLSFTPLQPAVVCEVRFDQLEGQRFRHTTTFLRWRPDRTASSCTFEQLPQQQNVDLSRLLVG